MKPKINYHYRLPFKIVDHFEFIRYGVDEECYKFGFNYIQKLLELDNRKIEVVNVQDNEENDLMEDFVSIITSFVARLYGKRRSKRLTEKIIKEIVNEDTKSI